MNDSLPLGLRQALESGQCVLFVGAGVGKHLLDVEGKPAPDAATLAMELATRFGINTAGSTDLAKVAQIVEIRKGRPELETFLRKRLTDLEPDETFRWLFSLRWRAIFTTNYDFGIQRAYALNPTPNQNPLTVTKVSDLAQFEIRLEIPIFHLHGTLFGSNPGPIVITQDDYVRFREHRRMMFEVLKLHSATSIVLYIGYSNRDPNWNLVLEEVRDEFLPASMPRSYRVTPDTDALDREILADKGVETVECSLADFRETATVALSAAKVPVDVLRRIGEKVPPELAVAFEQNPAAVARLLASWEYVNQAPFDAMPNVKLFLRGDRPNWALIGKRMQFERDLEEVIYDDLLDYATSGSKSIVTLVVLGPAGYGISTFLMAIAAKLVHDRVGSVFMHKPGSALVEGDIEFAASLFDNKRPFFILDNAADNVEAVERAVDRFRHARRAVLFLLGERLNEWRQVHPRIGGREFLLESLSDPEIDRLLACLEQHGELNQLEHLSPELRVAAIREKHGKQLLVAMREATEGNGFDAILEGEYRGIGDDLSRRLYLTVCCFYQHGAYVRDSLLAQLLELPLTEMYSKTADSTEGVVFYEIADPLTGNYAARARHRTIADIVWRRCGEAGFRERTVQMSLAALNLNYKFDRDTFDHFVRSDHVVDAIRTLDGKIQFFDTACRKDPESPYVRQHYARMLSREGRDDLALGQIDEGLKMNSSLRVLHHTRGVILSHLAMSIESTEVARRRLVQAEDAFRRCLAFYDRDDYAYQGLAELYLNWAKRAASESTEYLAKAEGVISEGLRLVRVRDGLWIVSSKINALIGDQPSCFHALEQAVKSTPGSIIARYLLGRAYRRAGSPEKAVATLGPLLIDHPDEFRACVEYARALLELGELYSKAIAALRLSTTYGLTDPRFVATLGGLLFMNEEFTEAKKIFEQSIRQEFPADEAARVEFRPRKQGDPKTAVRLKGKVVAVKTGYAFIQPPEFPAFLCPGSTYGGVAMNLGADIWFNPAFSARGALAQNPKLA